MFFANIIILELLFRLELQGNLSKPEPNLEPLPEEKTEDKTPGDSSAKQKLDDSPTKPKARASPTKQKSGDSPTKPKQEKKNSKAGLDSNKQDTNQTDANQTDANHNGIVTAESTESNDKDELSDDINLTEGEPIFVDLQFLGGVRVFDSHLPCSFVFF